MSKVFTQSQSIKFIEKVFGQGRLSNQGQNISVVCPMCRAFKGQTYSKQKLVIRTDNFLVHCWVCGYKNRNLLNLLRKYHPSFVSEYKENFLGAEDLSQIKREEAEASQPVFLPEGFELLANKKLSRDNYIIRAKKYLQSRGITSLRDLWYWKFGITKCTEEKCKYRIIIPSYDKFGNLNYWTARSWIPRVEKFGEKYRNPDVERTKIIFNENNIDWEEELTLVEGPFDLFKCNENATAVLGSELDANYYLFQQILKHRTPILLAFDNEEKAQKKQFKIANILQEFDIQVRIFENPHRDKDVGDLSIREFANLKRKAKPFSEGYFLRKRIASIV